MMRPTSPRLRPLMPLLGLLAAGVVLLATGPTNALPGGTAQQVRPVGTCTTAVPGDDRPAGRSPSTSATVPARDDRVAQGDPGPPIETIPGPPQPEGPLTVPYAPVRFRVRGLKVLADSAELEARDETGARTRFKMLSPRIPMFRPDNSMGRLESLAEQQWADVACISPPGDPRVAVAVVCPDPAPNTPMVCLRQSMGVTVTTMNTDRETIGVRDFLYHPSLFTYSGAIVLGPDGEEVGPTRLRPNQVLDLFWKDSPAPPVLFAIRIVR